MFTVRRRSADDMLLVEVGNNNPRGVERYLAEGASINGSAHSGEIHPPIVYAAAVGSARMIKFLAEKGADVDVGVWRKADVPKDSRAIHMAVSTGSRGALDALRALVKVGANVNTKDATGCTALMMACCVPKDTSQCVSMARELLAAGADVNLRDSDGRVALHYAAYGGRVELVDMLLSEPSLSTLNHVTDDGKTPLLVAVEFTHPVVLARLVAAGASQSAALSLDNYQCPFKSSLMAKREDLLRVLGTPRGMEAVGGAAQVIPNALACVKLRGVSRVLSLVLAAEGEERRAFWANHRLVSDKPVLSLAAGYGILSNVQVLLAAGALETNTHSPEGATASANIGTLMGPGGSLDPEAEAAIRRELDRGPAYRARSLLWPSETEAAGDGRCAEPLGVRIYRRTNPRFSFRTIQRYCLKN
eukprot:g2564.t1